MDLLLIGVTGSSLLMATGLSIVAWKLMRDGRDRSAARVEALEALAFGADTDEPLQTVAGSAARESVGPMGRVPPVPDDDDADREETPAAQWDLALREPRAPIPPVAHVAPLAPVAALRHAPVHEVMFDAPAPRAGRGRLWLALSAVGLTMVAGVVSVRALNSPEIAGALAASSDVSRAAHLSDTPPLQLLSLRHQTNAEGAFSVTGLVQNPAEGKTQRGLIAVVYVFDAQGEYFASGRASVDLETFQPGDESPFVVTIPATSGVSRYRVGFRYKDGGVVSHIDRRGPLPGDTAGGTIDLVEPAPIDRVKRSEG